MMLPGLVLSTMLIAGPTALDQPPNACVCMRTFTGGGDRAAEVSCDGFNPTTHVACACEKVPVGSQVACEPKKPASSGDDNYSHRRSTKPVGG
jgi:hypothetical protein